MVGKRELLSVDLRVATMGVLMAVQKESWRVALKAGCLVEQMAVPMALKKVEPMVDQMVEKRVESKVKKTVGRLVVLLGVKKVDLTAASLEQ